MKKLFLLITVLFSAACFAQTTPTIDSLIKIYKQSDPNSLHSLTIDGIRPNEKYVYKKGIWYSSLNNGTLIKTTPQKIEKRVSEIIRFIKKNELRRKMITI